MESHVRGNLCWLYGSIDVKNHSHAHSNQTKSLQSKSNCMKSNKHMGRCQLGSPRLCNAYRRIASAGYATLFGNVPDDTVVCALHIDLWLLGRKVWHRSWTMAFRNESYVGGGKAELHPTIEIYGFVACLTHVFVLQVSIVG